MTAGTAALARAARTSRLSNATDSATTASTHETAAEPVCIRKLSFYEWELQCVCGVEEVRWRPEIVQTLSILDRLSQHQMNTVCPSGPSDITIRPGPPRWLSRNPGRQIAYQNATLERPALSGPFSMVGGGTDRFPTVTFSAWRGDRCPLKQHGCCFAPPPNCH